MGKGAAAIAVLAALSVAVAGSRGPFRLRLGTAPRCADELKIALERSRDLAVVEAQPEAVVDVDARGEGLVLSLRSITGERLLERPLDRAAACEDVAFAARLIVERYARGIGLQLPPVATVVDAGTPGVPRPRAIAPHARARGDVAPDAGAAGPPVVDAGDGEAGASIDAGQIDLDAGPIDAGVADAGTAPDAGVGDVDAGPPPTLLSRAEVTAAAGVHFSSPWPVRAAFALEAALFFHAWRTALQLGTVTSDSTPVRVGGLQRGTLDTRAFSALLAVGYCRDWAVRLCGSAQAGARLTLGTSSGDFVFQQSTAVLLRPAFALEVQLAYRVLQRVVVGVSLSGLLNPVPADFAIQGVPEAGRGVPVVEGQLKVWAGLGFDRG